MTSEIAIPEQDNTLPDTLDAMETRFALATKQRELLEDYIMQRLKPSKHFYTVGDGQKPSLTKDGAELICLPHGYKPQYFIEGGPDQPPQDDVTAYQITVKCRLVRGQAFAGEGYGSASSMITKRDGERVVRTPDIGLRHNATLKMAQKSAYIAATLNSTAASEFFTQDMEDIMASGGAQARPAATNSAAWCADHNTEFFKRGKMKSYGHAATPDMEALGAKKSNWHMRGRPAEFITEPVQDSPQEPQGDAPDPEPVAQDTEGDEQTAVAFENKGALFTWAQGAYGASRDQVAQAAGYKNADSMPDSVDLAQAQQQVIALYGG